MSAPKTWQAILALQAALRDIQIGNGFRTDAGLRVLLDVFQLGESDVYPTLRLVEDELDEGQGSNGAVDAITLTVEGYIETAHEDAQRKAHDLRDDVLRVVRALKKPRCLPAPLIGLEVLSRRVLQRPEGFPYVVCQVGLRARLVNS